MEIWTENKEIYFKSVFSFFLFFFNLLGFEEDILKISVLSVLMLISG